MKKISFLVLALLAIGMSSCGGDDDSSSGSLVGKWKFSKIGSVVGGKETLVDYPNNIAECDKDYILFSADGAVEIGEYDYDNQICNLSQDIGMYKKSGSNLTLDYGDGADDDTVAKISKLTSNELKLKFTEDGESYIIVLTK